MKPIVVHRPAGFCRLCRSLTPRRHPQKQAALKEKARLTLAQVKKPKPVPDGQDQKGRVILYELDKQCVLAPPPPIGIRLDGR